MIDEISFEQLEGMYDPDALFVICCDVPVNFTWLSNYQNCEILKPLNVSEYKVALLTKDQFEAKYKSKLKSPIVREYIKYLKSLDNDVYLVTNVEHGFLLSNI